MDWISRIAPRSWRIWALLASSPLLFCSYAEAQPTPPTSRPSVTGRLVVQGEVPAAEPLGPGKDECCQLAKPVDQSVLVGPDGGLANVVVTVETRRGEPKLDTSWFEPVDVKTGEKSAYSLTNKGCAFKPRVLVVRTGHELVLANADPTMHNVNIDFIRNPGVNVVVEPDGRREILLKKAEPKPVAVRCNVHTFMTGWIVVRDNDLSASVSSETGEFRLVMLPPGERRLRFWHEGRPLVDLPINGQRTDKRGEVLVSLPESGTLDLGDIEVFADSLRP